MVVLYPRGDYLGRIPGLKTNYVLNFNNFSTSKPIFDLEVSLYRVYSSNFNIFMFIYLVLRYYINKQYFYHERDLFKVYSKNQITI